MAEKMIVVLVHGWSVSNTDTYGKLPDRLEREARAGRLPDVDLRNIWLSRYVSFRDEVRLEDLARGFEAALREELGTLLREGRRFACVTHSTGGPVVRDWWQRFYVSHGAICPMSHLVMLAPANFGSALAQLGKGRLSRIKSWFQGIEPGQGVLDWLELGSPESWDLNTHWIRNVDDPTVTDTPLFQFVLTGQSIDRKLYDHLNSYTGENGSDGVVRVAAANLNATYLRIEQERPVTGDASDRPVLRVVEHKTAPRTAFALVAGRSHSGEDMGILRSVTDTDDRHPTVKAVCDCLRVRSRDDYATLCDALESSNEKVREKERVERARFLVGSDTVVHDRHTMVLVRMRDAYGHVVGDFDFVLTGRRNDPNKLPRGFFVDRQRNSRDRGTIVYYLNYDLMVGCGPVSDRRGKVRAAQPGVGQLGLYIDARPNEGYVHYVDSGLAATRRNVLRVLRPDATTLIEIVLRRVVRQGAYRLTRDRRPTDFRQQPWGMPID